MIDFQECPSEFSSDALQEEFESIVIAHSQIRKAL